MKKKRRSSSDLDKVAAAEAILRESRTLSRDPERLLRTVAEGKPVRLPRYMALMTNDTNPTRTSM